MKVQAAIFDVFGTLVDWRTGVATVAARSFAAKSLDIDPLAFADAWRGEYQPAMERIRSGNRGYIALDDLHRENLDRVLATFAIADRFTPTEKQALNTAWEHLPPWPDTPAGLDAIRQHAMIAPCSNGSIALMTRLARNGGLRWDCILGADIAQTYKPEPEAYLAAARALRLDPGEVLMVAAHNDDLAAAKAQGLQTAFIPRPDEQGPDTGETEATGDWTFATGTLADLAQNLAS